MKKTVKKVLTLSTVAVILIATVLIVFIFFSDSETERAAKKAAHYVAENSEVVFGNEWTAIVLARGNYGYTSAWLSPYKAALVDKITSSEGKFDDMAYSAYARCVIACCFADCNPTDINGYDLTAYLYDIDKVMERGVTGGVFALIALDICDANNKLIDEYVDIILENQHENGAFGINKQAPDVDVTAMALQALSAHMERADVKEAVDKALEALSGLQQPNGGFATLGVVNSQSTAQVIVALDALCIPIDDISFVKNGNSSLDALMRCRCNDGGFSRTEKEKVSSVSATVQALQALTAINSDDAFFVKR